MSDPIFLVGVPRSGTTLLAAMLAAHSRLSCGPETHFFAALRKTSARRVAARRLWPAAGLELLCGFELEGETILQRYGLKPETARGLLRNRPPAISSLLEAVLRHHQEATGKQRWLEKSPIHLLYLDEVRQAFPTARIVRIVRDPRDVALSLLGVPWGPQSFAGGLLYWRRFTCRSQGFFDRRAGTVTVRFEDLVAAPERQLERVCAFLGESFEPGMLVPGAAAASLRRDHETWKRRVERPLDASRAGRWRHRLGTLELELAEALVGDQIARHGYQAAPGVRPRRSYVWLIPESERAAPCTQVLSGLAAAGGRIWIAGREMPSEALFCGFPDADGWLGARTGERLASAGRILTGLVAMTLARRPVRWVRSDAPTAPGVLERILRQVLGWVSRRTDNRGEARP